MEQIHTFIGQVSSGQAAEARETLNDLISSRALEALSIKKQEMASTVFGGKPVEEPKEETTETE